MFNGSLFNHCGELWAPSNFVHPLFPRGTNEGESISNGRIIQDDQVIEPSGNVKKASSLKIQHQEADSFKQYFEYYFFVVDE